MWGESRERDSDTGEGSCEIRQLLGMRAAGLGSPQAPGLWGLPGLEGGFTPALYLALRIDTHLPCLAFLLSGGSSAPLVFLQRAGGESLESLSHMAGGQSSIFHHSVQPTRTPLPPLEAAVRRPCFHILCRIRTLPGRRGRDLGMQRPT